MIDTMFRTRFAELEQSFASLPYRTMAGLSGRYVPDGQWRRWATSVQNLIRATFGESSPHYANFVALYQGCGGGDHDVAALNAVFMSAKEDFEGGYVFNVELRVSGEVFGNFVALAKQSLAEGHIDVAAVLACAALEDALKRLGETNGLDVGEAGMQEVVNALKSAGVVAGAQKTLLDAMPRIRNMAMHAAWGKLSELDVGSVIAFVEQLLLQKFSGT